MIAPTAVVVNVPDNVKAGRTMPLPLKVNVTLRNPLGITGTTAVADVFRNERSRTLPLLVITGVVLNTFALVDNKRSEFAAVSVKVGVPVTVKIALCEIVPPAVTSYVPDTVDAPNAIAFVSNTLTLLPVVTANVLKLLVKEFNVILLAAPAFNVVVPVIFNAPLCVIAPAEETVNVPDAVSAESTIPLLSVNVTFRKPLGIIGTAVEAVVFL